MSLSEKNLREKKFHNELQSRPNGRFENIFYKSLFNLSEDFFKSLKSFCSGADVLDFGCGTGGCLKKVLEFNPRKITGIDISEVSIEKAKKSIATMEKNLELLVDNCEKTKFEDNKFDVVYGTGILHHLQISECIYEIRRLLKPGGKMLFIEPLGTNPLINFYRMLTPKSRSKDEHPLLKKDFDLIKKKFVSTKIKYYGFLTLVFFPFYKQPDKSRFFQLLQNADQFLFKYKLFKKLAWSVLIIAEKN